MYSPKVREDLIPPLYKLKIKLKRPMTHLVSEAVSEYLKKHEEEKETHVRQEDRRTG